MRQSHADHLIHASSVAFVGQAVLIVGASGSGKSALSLDLISRGFRLVSDDQTALTMQDGQPIARAPEKLSGLIEARGVGLLKADFLPAAPVRLVVDLDTAEQDRLPPRRTHTVLACEIDLICGKDHPNLAPAVQIYLAGGRVD